MGKKKVIIAAFVMLILSASHAHADIQTKQDADAFLDFYCIELVKAVQGLYEEQKVLAAEAKRKEFFKKGSYIGGIANIYSKLCK